MTSPPLPSRLFVGHAGQNRRGVSKNALFFPLAPWSHRIYTHGGEGTLGSKVDDRERSRITGVRQVAPVNENSFFDSRSIRPR